MPLPAESHTVRICSATRLGDNGEVLSTCFAPHVGSDLRTADGYLSVHWLEYLGRGTFPECLARLREYLLNSPVAGEYKPSRKGKLAVLHCETVSQSTLQNLNVPIDFAHMPRLDNVASSISVTEDGKVVIGVAPEQAANNGQALDPHSGLFTIPEEAAHQLAVQQQLARLVVHSEPGII